MEQCVWYVIRLSLTIWLSYAISVFIHEAGHAITCVLSGGVVRVVAVGRVVWIPGCKVLLWKEKLTHPGQCIAFCKTKVSYAITMAGGLIFTLLETSCLFGIERIQGSDAMFQFVILIPSLCILIVNLIPIRCLQNDGYRFFQIARNCKTFENHLKNQRKIEVLLEWGLMEEFIT